MTDLREILGSSHLDALDGAEDLSPTPANLDRVAKSFGVEASRWAFEQWELRKRGQTKFEKAEAMLFDRESLEMATHERVARSHAAQFPSGELVADLTCGIGADLIALAHRGPAIGFEVNPIRAAMARHNLHVYELDADIRVEDCLGAEWNFEYALADPARRGGGRRAVRADDYQPALPVLAERMSRLNRGIIKVSPMLPDQILHAYGRRLDFWSFGGECREAILSVGLDVEESDSVGALHVETGMWLRGSDGGRFAVEFEPLEEPLDYVFEADPAAIRAHLLPELGERLAAQPLGDSHGYLTGTGLPRDAIGRTFSRAFRVFAFGKADLKRIREALREHDATVEVVKTRGVPQDPVAWRAKLKSSGAKKLILLLYPVGRSVRFVLATKA